MQRLQDIEGRISMSKIAKVFENGKAFIPFITCGDPDLETTEQIVYAMERAGADMIELGIPFSDPTAEGPVIMQADLRALSTGATTNKVFEMVERIRKNTQIPICFMTYANVVYSHGIEKFVKEAAALGIDGLILPDVSFEESHEFSDYCDQYGIDYISFVALTSGERIDHIVENAKGFIYCVSSMGVTGTRAQITTDIKHLVESIKKVKDIPVAIGFGISNPEQASQMAAVSDGVIVGSAIVKICAEYGKESVGKIEDFVRSMKNVISKG